MSSAPQNPVHVAVKALEAAMRAAGEHHHRVAASAYAARAVPPVAVRPPLPESDQAGGAA